jgi:hypothetical protein
MSSFQHPKQGEGTISIGSLDEPSPANTVDAQFNPKELEIARSNTWTKTNPANNKDPSKDKSNGINLEFTGAEGRSTSVELLFDGYETGASIADKVNTLNKLASARDPDSTDPKLRRPHLCVVTWGSLTWGEAGANAFSCVIEKVSTKYTMFSATGVPLRATCTVSLKEATKVDQDAGGQ